MPEDEPNRVGVFRITDAILVPSWLGMLLVITVTCSAALFFAAIWIGADVRSELRQLRAEIRILQLDVQDGQNALIRTGLASPSDFRVRETKKGSPE